MRSDDSDNLTIAADNTENTEPNCTGILKYIFTSARPFRANSKKEKKNLNRRNNNIKKRTRANRNKNYTDFEQHTRKLYIIIIIIFIYDVLYIYIDERADTGER